MLTEQKSKWVMFITMTALFGFTIFIFSGCAETTDITNIDIIDVSEEQSLEIIASPKAILTEIETVIEAIEETEEIEIIEAESEEAETSEIIATAAVMASISDNIFETAQNLSFEENSHYVVFNDRNTVRTMDMRQKSNISEEALREYLTRFPNLAGIASTLIEAQETYNVNAIMLLAIIRLESGNGQSRIAVSENNLGGIVAPANSVAVYRSFDSQEECVIFMARLLSNQYLTEEGRFFSGYTLVDINKRYSVSSDWSTLVGNLMVEIQNSLNKFSEHF